MLRKLIVFALILCVALPTLAQVELRVDVDVSSDFKELTDDNKTVVDFLYLTQKDEFCTTFLIDDTQYEPSVCVFEDIITDELHLYAFGSITTYFIVFYEGQAVALLARDMGVSNLRPGNYEILVLRGWSTKTPRALVSFTISDDSDVVVSDVVESIELETPELGTTWQRSEKHEMKSGCNVSYALIDFDPPAIVVVLKEEKTMREVTSHELYGGSLSPLVPGLEEEGDWEGVSVFLSVYLNPKDQEEYTLRYEHTDLFYEVAFEYERGITSKRNVAGAIVIEC